MSDLPALMRAALEYGNPDRMWISIPPRPFGLMHKDTAYLLLTGVSVHDIDDLCSAYLDRAHHAPR